MHLCSMLMTCLLPFPRAIVKTYECWSSVAYSRRPPSAGPAQQQKQAPDLALAAGGGLEEITEVNNETPAAARAELYRSRSALFMTTRILVVDFLNRRLQPSQVCRFLLQFGRSFPQYPRLRHHDLAW